MIYPLEGIRDLSATSHLPKLEAVLGFARQTFPTCEFAICACKSGVSERNGIHILWWARRCAQYSPGHCRALDSQL